MTLNLVAGNVIAALVTHVEKRAAWIEGAVPGIVPHRRDFPHERELSVAIDVTDGDRIVQSIGDIQESAIG